MKNVLIYLKKNDKRAEILSDEIAQFLNTQKIETLILNVGESCPKKDSLDLVIVLGGDGSLLAATRCVNKMLDKNKTLPPFLGINLGSLGFLTECRAEEALDVLKKGINKKFEIEHRTMIEVDGKSALNEITITRSSIARVVDFDIYVNEEFVSSVKADGVIVSTPTGSTAYSLASGGPILHPEIDALVITPISPHTLTNRPIVVSDSSIIKFVVNSDPENVMVTLDGQIQLPLKSNGEFCVTKHSRPLPLVRPYGRTYFSILRDKLAFGKRGHN